MTGAGVLAEGLTKKYQPPRGIYRIMTKAPIAREIVAVDGVDLRIDRGELFGLIGQNGAGKTSLIKMLATLLLPTAGRAEVNGFDVVRQEIQVKASIGFVSGEDRSFYWRLSGRENLAFFASMHNLDRAIADKRISDILRTLGLESAGDDMYYGYSSGMKQKLMIGRGLLTDPKILFLDEPTRGVDAVAADEIKRLVRRLVDHQGRTVILTSHRLVEVEQLCDRIAIIDGGRIGFTGTIKALTEQIRPQDRYLIELRIDPRHLPLVTACCSDSTVADMAGPGLYRLQFSSNGAGPDVSSLIKVILQSGGEITALRRVEPSLEELFLEYIGEGAN